MEKNASLAKKVSFLPDDDQVAGAQKGAAAIAATEVDLSGAKVAKASTSLAKAKSTSGGGKSQGFSDLAPSQPAMPKSRSAKQAEGPLHATPFGTRLKMLQITVVSLESNYKTGLGKMDKADPVVEVEFNRLKCTNSVAIRNNPEPCFDEAFSFLLEEAQMRSCLLLEPDDPMSSEASEDKNADSNYITFRLDEHEMLTGREQMGRRKLHLNYFCEAGKVLKGMKHISLYNVPSDEDKGKEDALNSSLDTSQQTNFSGFINEGEKVTKRHQVGVLNIEFEFRDMQSQDALDAGAGYVESTDRRAVDGVLEVTLKNALGLDSARDYTAGAQIVQHEDRLREALANKGGSTLQDNQQVLKDNIAKLHLPSFQAHTKFSLACDKMFESWLLIHLQDEKKKKRIGSFYTKLSNAHGLVDGQKSLYLFHRLEASGNAPSVGGDGAEADVGPQKGKEEGKGPAMIVQLNYLNSIYTRKKGQGEIKLLIRSWMSNKEVLPTNAWAKFRLFNPKGEIKLEDTQLDGAKYDSTLTIGREKAIQLEDIMTQIELTIYKKSGGFMAFGSKDQILGTRKLYVAELFGNTKIPAIVERYYQTEFVDKKNETILKISCVGTFTPRHSTEQEREEWERNRLQLVVSDKDSKSKLNRSKSLMKKNEAVIIDKSSKLKEAKKKKFRMDAADYQGLDIFTIKLDNRVTFEANTKGLLVFQLQRFELRTEQRPEGSPKYFMLISTGKEVFRTRSVGLVDESTTLHFLDDIVKLQTHDIKDHVYFRLYEEHNPTMQLSEQKFDLCMILRDKIAFQKIPHRMNNFKGQLTGNLQVNLMYRASEFTRQPRGRLELNLDSACQLRLKDKEYNPTMEFILGDQRILVDETLQMRKTKMNTESEFKRWGAQKTLVLDTANVHEVIIIKFYERVPATTKGGKDELTLLGSEMFELSSLILTRYDAEQEKLHQESHKLLDKEKGKGALLDDCQYENVININLKRVSRQMTGEIAIKCNYQPRMLTKVEAGIAEKQDIMYRIREHHLAQKKNAGANKKDAISSMHSAVSASAQKGAICYVNLDFIQLSNMDARRCLALRHVLIEMSYAKTKVRSSVSVNLGMLKNKHLLNEKMHIFLKDISDKIQGQPGTGIYDDKPIYIKAYSIDNRKETKGFVIEGEQEQTIFQKTLIGVTTVNTAIFRQINNTEIKVQALIPIPAMYDTQTLEEEVVEQSEEDDDVDDFQNMADGLLTKMNQDLNNMKSHNEQKLKSMKKAFVIQLSVLTVNTKVVRNTLGILSMSEFSLLNLDKRFQDFTPEKGDKHSVKLQVTCNSMQMTSESAELVPVDRINNNDNKIEDGCIHKDGFNFHPIGGNQDQLFSEGRSFKMINYVKQKDQFGADEIVKEPCALLQWQNPRQFNTFISSPLDQVEIKVIVETQNLDSGENVQFVVGKTVLKVSEMSVFLEAAQQGKAHNFAVEMQYLPLNDDKVALKESILEPSDKDAKLYGYESLKEEHNHKNLLSKVHEKELILMMEVNFTPDVIKGTRELKMLKSQANKFVLPEVVSYNDSINSGFDAMMRKQKKAKQQEKLKKNQQLSAIKATEPGQGVEVKNKNTHLAFEIKLDALGSFLHKHADQEQLHCFATFEPQFELKKYTIIEYLSEKENSKKFTFASEKEKQAAIERRIFVMSKGLGEVSEDLIIQPQHIFPQDLQVTEIFTLENLKKNILDKKMSCWFKQTSNKVIFTLFVEKVGQLSKLHEVHAEIKDQPLMQSNTVLGINQRSNMSIMYGEIQMHQAVIDFEDALKFDKKGPEGEFIKNTVSSRLSQRLDMSVFTLENTDNLLYEHLVSNQGKFEVDIQTSDFIDCPAGDLNIIIKSISSANNQLFSDQCLIRLEMLSTVSRDKILTDVSNQKDLDESLVLSRYSLKSTDEAGFNKILMNHVTNMVARHYQDSVLIEVIQKDKVVAQTTLELKSINLENGKTKSFIVIATGPQRIVSQKPMYYKLEIDISFASKTSKSPKLSKLEQAIQNYMMMMGKSKLTPMELEILKMLIERQELGAKLTPSRIRFRKTFFFMRNLHKVEYKTLDNLHKVQFLVSPLTFLFQVFSSSSLSQNYDHYRTLDLRQRVEAEFGNCKPIDENLLKALELQKKKENDGQPGMINFNEGNVLQIKMPEEGIDLEKYDIKNPNVEMKVSKLEFSVHVSSVGKPAKQVYRKVFGEQYLLSNQAVMQNQVLFIENVSIGSEIKFSLNIVPKQDDFKASRAAKREIFRPLGPASSLYLTDFTSKLQNNNEIETSLNLCHNSVDISFKVTQNQLTKQPNRVIGLTFHRLVKLNRESDFVQELEPSTSAEGQPNNIKMILVEDPCINKLNEIVRLEDIMPMEDEERGQAKSSAIKKDEEIAKGSINDMIKNQTKEEQKLSTNYNMFIDFDTCEPYKGAYHASHKFDINKFGKTVDKEINKLEINNTKASNKIKFKIFRDGSRQSERLRQFGIGTKPSDSASERNEDEEVGLLASAEINICNIHNFWINKPASFVFPLTQFRNGDLDPQCLNYKIEDVYVLFTVTVTDKAFGELVMDLSEFRGLPECKSIREMQYRVVVKPSKASAIKEKISGEAGKPPPEKDELEGAGQAPRIEPIFVYQSPRIPYEIGNLSQLAVARELIVGVKMKDIFANRRLFMSNTAKEIFEDQDQRMFIDFFGFDKLHTKMLIGQLEMSLIELIQTSLAQEAELTAQARIQTAKQAREEASAAQEAEKDPKKAAAEEQVSGKSLALEQEQAKRVALAQDEARRVKEHRNRVRKMRKAGATEPEIQQAQQEFEQEGKLLMAEQLQIPDENQNVNNRRDSMMSGASRSSRASALNATGISNILDATAQSAQIAIPEGKTAYLLENVTQTADEEERTDFAMGADRPAELVSFAPGVKLIGSMKWFFSFQEREQKTEAYYANQAEQQELERIRQKKEIPNILKTLGKLRGDADLLTKNLEMLSLALASESCGPSSDSVLLPSIPKLLMQFRSIFIEFKDVELPVGAIISLMRCCIYMKIISKHCGTAELKSYRQHFNKAGIFPFITELFEDYKNKSRLVSIKILNFLTFMINDIQELYFQNLSGVRLDALIEYATMNPQNSGDTEILMAHCQFVSAVCYCLFEHRPTEKTEAVVKADLKRISQCVYAGVKHLISGGVNSQYKADFERIAKLYSDVAIRVVHLSIQKFTLIVQEKDNLLSKIFESLYVLLVDSIASGLGFELVEGLKKQITYEIILIQNLEIKRDLGLMFDSAEVASKLKMLLDIYQQNLDYNLKRQKGGLTEDDEGEYRRDTQQYYANIKPILKFFCTEDLMDSFGENNTKQIQAVLLNPFVSNAEDFIIFLHAVVKADLANESEIEGEDARTRQLRIKKSRYGTLTNINKFSLTHIEWLEEAMPQMAGLM